MADHSSESIPFPVLTHVLRMDYHQAVVHYALTHRAEVTLQARRWLEEAIRAEVQIKGSFRDPTTAPLLFIAREVVKCCNVSNRLFGAVLQVWVESHASLQEAVRQFLTSRGTPVVHATDLQDGFTNIWSPSKMLETAEDFLTKHVEDNRDDVALMLCCLTSQAPLPEKDMEEANQADGQDTLEEEHSVNWDRWLAELRALPAEAPKWDGADAFGEAFRQLVEAKRQERDHRLRLQQAFTALATQGTEELAFFDMTDVQAWMAEACPLEEAVAVTEKVNELLSLLIRHRGQNQQPAPTYAEERLRRKNLEQLEEQIKQLHDDLVSVFMPSSVPPLPQPVSQGPFLKEEQPQEQEVLLNPFTADASPNTTLSKLEFA